MNYRRFFDINDLAGLRVEDPATFRAIHALVARLIAADQLQGLRLDHIDGLRDPGQYTKRLSAADPQDCGARPDCRRRSTSSSRKFWPTAKQMPRFPGVAGTTGYEWLNMISHVLVDGRGLDRLDATWREFSRRAAGISPRYWRRRSSRVIDTILASEFGVLVPRACAHRRRPFHHARLHARPAARGPAALCARISASTAHTSPPPARPNLIAPDRRNDRPRAHARWHGPDPQIFDFLRDAVTLDLAAQCQATARRACATFALKLQQFTGPLMAKAMEDTAFYRYHRLLAFNEVGGDPTAGELPIRGLSRSATRARRQPAPGG